MVSTEFYGGFGVGGERWRWEDNPAPPSSVSQVHGQLVCSRQNGVRIIQTARLSGTCFCLTSTSMICCLTMIAMCGLDPSAWQSLRQSRRPSTFAFFQTQIFQSQTSLLQDDPSCFSGVRAKGSHSRTWQVTFDVGTDLGNGAPSLPWLIGWGSTMLASLCDPQPHRRGQE